MLPSLASDSGVVVVQRIGRPSSPRFQAKLRKAQLRTVAGMIPPFFLVFYFKYAVCQNALQQRRNVHPFVQGVERGIIDRAGTSSPCTMLSLTFPALQWY